RLLKRGRASHSTIGDVRPPRQNRSPPGVWSRRKDHQLAFLTRSRKSLIGGRLAGHGVTNAVRLPRTLVPAARRSARPPPPRFLPVLQQQPSIQLALRQS